MIVLVAGVSGSGKTTVGVLLARRLGWLFEDGDDLHPAANIAKMHAGVPLTDEDRRPWLAAVMAWVDQRIAAGEQAVIACSALRRSYRDELRHGRPSLRIVFLEADRATLAARLAARHGHFFQPGLLASQLADAEIPLPSEPAIVLMDDQPADALAQDIMGRLGLAAYGGASGGSEMAP
jgi:carbohydrate kinase (thermoresistant glucokinase family)